MTAPGAPAIIEPAGPGSPWDPMRFKFPTGAPAPDRWDLQMSASEDFGGALLWAPTNQSAGIAGRKVSAPYAGPGLVTATQYWWRARGRNGGDIGDWSRKAHFRPDAAAVRGIYETWARAVLMRGAWPSVAWTLGAILPTGPQVAQLLATPHGARWRIVDDEHPPATDELAEVFGVTFHVDAESGWEVASSTLHVLGD